MTSRQPARVTVVTASSCHLCEDAQAALAALARDHRLTVQLVAAESQAGQALLHRHGSGMFPLVLIDDVFFSAGRLPRRKLSRLLAAAPSAEPSAAASAEIGVR